MTWRISLGNVITDGEDNIKGKLKKSNTSVCGLLHLIHKNNQCHCFVYTEWTCRIQNKTGNILISWATISVQKGLWLVELFYLYVILTELNVVLCLAHIVVWVLLSIFICFHPEEEGIYFSETLITIYMVSYHRCAWPLFSLFPRFLFFFPFLLSFKNPLWMVFSNSGIYKFLRYQ